MEGRISCVLLLILVLHWQNAQCQLVVHMSQHLPQQTEDSWRRAEATSGARRNFSFASYYGDHMVLQRAPQRAVVWGYHPHPGTRIIVQVKGGKIYGAKVDSAGVWKVTLEPQSSGGPVTIAAMSETLTIELRDVLFGDLWLCSGQSNMQFTLNKAYNWTEEAKEAVKFKDIRLFSAQRRFSKVPLADLPAVMEPWSLPRNDTLGHGGDYFSAICWLFGKSLHQQLQRPIGLIDATWGGTPIESWMSADALRQCGFKPQSSASVEAQSKGTHTAVTPETPMTPGTPVSSDQDHGQLWNAMIHPFTSLTLYGVIWDQGENDAFVPRYRDRYNCTFPAMIQDWRHKFSVGTAGQTSAHFPFGFVQLGSSYQDAVISSGVPDIRWHQTADYGYVPNPRMKNVFMSVSMDITDFSSPYAPVHTRDKADIAHRLFLGALSVAYNMSALWQGPLPSRLAMAAGGLVLDYGHTWTLQLRQREGFENAAAFMVDKNSPTCEISPLVDLGALAKEQKSSPNVMLFALNGSRLCKPSEGKAWWVPTPITAANATHLQLYAGVCSPGQSILGLRYAWRLSPCPFKGCAVYSKENALPAPPFVVYLKGLESKSRGVRRKIVIDFDWKKPVHL